MFFSPPVGLNRRRGSETPASRAAVRSPPSRDRHGAFAFAHSADHPAVRPSTPPRLRAQLAPVIPSPAKRLHPYLSTIRVWFSITPFRSKPVTYSLRVPPVLKTLQLHSPPSRYIPRYGEMSTNYARRPLRTPLFASLPPEFLAPASAR